MIVKCTVTWFTSGAVGAVNAQAMTGTGKFDA